MDPSHLEDLPSVRSHVVFIPRFRYTFNNDVHLFVLVLPYIATEHPPSTSTRRWVASVNGATPHVADPIGINL